VRGGSPALASTAAPATTRTNALTFRRSEIERLAERLEARETLPVFDGARDAAKRAAAGREVARRQRAAEKQRAKLAERAGLEASYAEAAYRRSRDSFVAMLRSRGVEVAA